MRRAHSVGDWFNIGGSGDRNVMSTEALAVDAPRRSRQITLSFGPSRQLHGGVRIGAEREEELGRKRVWVNISTI
jgi:hypothetical protein